MQVQAADVYVNVRDISSGIIANRTVTFTLIKPQGSAVAGPWIVAGDSVSQRTDATGIAWFSNMVAVGEYRMDLTGNPSRSFPFNIASTNGTYNVIQLFGTNQAVEMFYDTAQIDGMLSSSNAIGAFVSRNGGIGTNLVTDGGGFLITNSATPGNTATLTISGNTSSGGFQDSMTSDPSGFSINPANNRGLRLTTPVYSPKGQTSGGIVVSNGLGATVISASSSGVLEAQQIVSDGSFVGNGVGISNVLALSVIAATNDPPLNGDYQSVFSPASDASQVNRIRQGNFTPLGALRNSGAAFSGIYSRQYGGSASAMSDLPSRGNDVWDGKRYPYFIISTRQSAGTTPDACKISTVTNLVNLYVTNTYVQAWTNAGFRLAMMLENGWQTNSRSANDGFLMWNTNRFPLTTWIINGYNSTNLTYYLGTNGFETFLMLYNTSLVPATNFWPNNNFSLSFCNTSGNTEWDNSGANPFGGAEYYVTVNPESMHRDVSSFYAQGINGVIFQNVNFGNTGYIEQIARSFGYASKFPFLYNSDMVLSVANDSSWFGYYGYPNSGRHAVHPLFLGQMMTSTGEWIPNFGNDFNTLITGSNDAITPPVASTGHSVGWLMAQVKWEALMITNSFGYWHPTFSGDGFNANSWIYQDWYDYCSIHAFLNANVYLLGDSGGTFPSYPYTVSSGFTNLIKNQNFLRTLRDVTGLPPIADSFTTNSSVWHRKMTDGSTLVLMENETGSPLALSINAGQMGILSNVVMTPIDVITNKYLGLATNSFSWTVPATASFLFKIPAPVVVSDAGSNVGQMYYDAVNNSTIIRGPGGSYGIRLSALNGGTVGISTNEVPPASSSVGLTVKAPGAATAYAVEMQDSSGGTYDFGREGTHGFWQVIGQQGNANSGAVFGTSGGDNPFGEFTGAAIMNCTNALSAWPTAPLTRGGFALVNSNSFVYLLQSDPAGLTWTSTNKIGK